MPFRFAAVFIALLALSPWTVVARHGSSPPMVVSPQPGGSAEPADGLDPPILDDVKAAFARIQTSGEHVTVCANGLIPKPQYRPAFNNFLFGLRNHFQGIQRLPQPGYFAVSGSNKNSSDLFIVRLNGPADFNGCERDGAMVARIALDDVLGHVGGLSMLGPILAVPMHGGSPRIAKVAFYDLSDPESPRRLPVEIPRPGRKASAAAFTRLPNGQFLVAVLAQFDGLPLRLDFYLSRTSELAGGFLPESRTWRVSAVEASVDQDPTFSHFQSINFIRQADGRLYLIGFHNSFAPQTIFPGRDYADLYEVVFASAMTDGTSPQLGTPRIVKVGNRMFRCTDGFCNLDAAAGLFVDPVTQAMSVYATPGWLDGDALKVTVYSSTPGKPGSDARYVQ